MPVTVVGGYIALPVTLRNFTQIQGSKVTLLSSYSDRSGLFTSEPEEEDGDSDKMDATAATHHSSEQAQGRTAADEEDELLYGDIEALTKKEKSVLYTYMPMFYVHVCRHFTLKVGSQY